MSRITIKTEIPPGEKSIIEQSPIPKDFQVTHLVFNSGAIPGIYLSGLWQNGKRIIPAIFGIPVLTLTNRIRNMVLKANTALKLEFSNKSKNSVVLDLEIHGHLRG